jgi:diguanylate cyclase (GGDEF)-like protein
VFPSDEHHPRRPMLFGTIARLSMVPVARLTAVVVTLVIVIGVSDYLTGSDISFAVAYVLPVFLAATAGTRLGLATAAAAAGTWTSVEAILRSGRYGTIMMPAWNLLARFMVLWLVAALVHALAATLDRERQVARTDALTGLRNARSFRESADAAIRHMRLTGDNLTIAYVDVDDFKVVNDTYGHARGDELLVSISRAMAATASPGATVARIGGDEFAVLLPGVDLMQAQDRMNAMRAALATATAPWKASVGLSIGTATFDSPPASSADLIAAADRVMYSAKRQGKNATRVEQALV